MKYNKHWLIASLSKGDKVKYLFFWGHQPAKNGEISATCFSQWWDGHPFEENKIIYKTAEHYMMAKKAELFNDGENLEKILNCKTPGDAKKHGRMVRGFNQEIWEKARCEIVVNGNKLKFDQHKALKKYLLTTNERILVEASPRDTIWGIGLGRNNEKSQDPNKWRGKNLLGFCLMEVRDALN